MLTALRICPEILLKSAKPRNFPGGFALFLCRYFLTVSCPTAAK